MCGITQPELKSLLSYDPETGDFTWLVGKMAGKKAVSIDTKGYLLIMINYKSYKSHRLAWLYVYGTMPETDLDHINGVPNDNRICNLRECSNTENAWNTGVVSSNTSGFKGASWRKDIHKWQAHIKINGKQKFLGYFDSREMAGQAYQSKARELHGEFYRETEMDSK